MAGEGEVRWNPRTQRWDTGDSQAPYTPPPPPRPGFEPTLGPGPDGDQGPGPGDGGRRPANRVVAVLTAAVLVGAGAGFGGWFLWGRDDTTRDDARTEVSTAPTAGAATDGTDGDGTGAGGSTPSESAQTAQGTSAAPSPSDPPPGYRTASEGEFDIVVPETWQSETESGKAGVTIHYFREPGDGPRYVQVFRVSEPGATPRGTLQAAEKDLKRLAPEYRRNGLDGVTDVRGEAAELDYSSRSEKWGIELRTLDRVFHADTDQLYVVLVAGPADEWPKQREVMDTAAGSFCLGGALDGVC